MSNYHLRTDHLGRKRLDLQGQVYNPGSQKFLLEQRIKAKQSILEIGCGSGSMTVWLAQQVGKQGRVVCIDNDKKQVVATQRAVNKAKLTHVECRELSVYGLAQLNEKFDIIYLRFILIHLDQPHRALQNVFSCLKKNGRIIIEEMLNSCNFCYPQSAIFDKRRYLIEQFFIKNGKNPNFALTLKSMVKKIKLSAVQESLYQPILQSTKERQLLSMLFYEIKDKLISLEILTLTEWNKFMQNLLKLQTDKKYFIALSSLYQISLQNVLR